ncbi:MAG: 30S ribosomal protein S4 [Flavobacteriales bacterium]|jgi:small subunit ribosomal protein S4|uniref:30S ribosomal protein S4 n=1 Tax=Blattabacterium sp. (Mastotermes darwiniensis) TaxID=39768 RepID=UPI000231DE5B|nr:30S ribosomal protein S4 [Blattabacterium sp. (Mastotermes darwiniensis)]AER40655.1 30S ribosomal protein S4 [Blattabacterium sp. (Mastotermes darwiniensis) str. MADAR]MDR1804817.1 30S ribosomal protein S4 [Flavobacteriales bacterium]
MAKYIGPKTKISRKFGECVYGEDKYFERRKYPSGQHGNNRRRGKRSEYFVQLSEKQRAKYTYGILERQFKRLFTESSRKKGITGELILQACESRLDNIVFRLKFAPSRSSARQIVSHRHVVVNDHIVNIPSFRLKPGDKIGIREKSKNHPVILESIKKISSLVEWLILDEKKMVGIFRMMPKRTQIPENIKEQLIVEFYSK